MKEHTVKLTGDTKKYVVELPNEADKTCALDQFIKALDFVKEADEFKTVQLQRYLKCGFGTVCKVLDALCVLCAVEKNGDPPNIKYISLMKQ
jgi:hypothetical protein